MFLVGLTPGIPAKVSGTVCLCGGSIVYIVIGQQGGSNRSFDPAGGGGGTFVFVQSLLQPSEVLYLARSTGDDLCISLFMC